MRECCLLSVNVRVALRAQLSNDALVSVNV